MSSEAALEGSCHCGACRVHIPRLPESVTRCNCSLCLKSGWRGIYFSSDELQISGEFDGYVRSDLDEVYLRTLRCTNCGVPTHWELLTPPPHERMGVNANLFDPALFAGLPVKEVDGASW